MNKVLCFGGRDYQERIKIAAALERVLSSFDGEPFAIIQGGARGADRLCGEWGALYGFPVIEVRANWEYYGRAAGSTRNVWMAEICSPDYAVGFPGGSGTRHMESQCRARKIPLWLPYGS